LGQNNWDKLNINRENKEKARTIRILKIGKLDIGFRKPENKSSYDY